MTNLKILAFAGSLSKNSINKKLTRWACKQLENEGIEVTFIDLADYPLPVYNQDILGEEFPKEADELAKLTNNHNVWLISSPENNYTITTCMKNFIDWTSRTPNNQHNPKVFSNKIIGLMSTSPSPYGGLKSTNNLRNVFLDLGCFVIPRQANVANEFTAFDDNGDLISDAHQKLVKSMLEQLVTVARLLVS